MNNKEIEKDDFKRILQDFSSYKKFNNSTILITGYAGFIGYYLVKFLISERRAIKWKKLILVDNFKTKSSEKINLKKYKDIDLINSNILKINFKLKKYSKINYIFHMASIASPHFYRKYPLETIDANVSGLKILLDSFKNKKISLLFFSSSEIYGDPPKKFIPTKESYFGNVSTIGPRSCYDESKRFCETLCYYYEKKYKISIKIVRPFNNYGPGLSMKDKRLPADLSNYILKNLDIIIHSNGSPSRTFCYISDALTGFLLAITHDKFDIFNIGNDQNEITVYKLAKLYQKIGKKYFSYSKKIIMKKSSDKEYLTNNPHRRRPDITKAKKILNYSPKVKLIDGVERYLYYLNSL